MRQWFKLEEALSHELPYIGGKALGLFRLVNLGLRIPRSVVLNSRWVEAVLSQTEIKSAYEQWLKTLQQSNSEKIKQATRELQRCIGTASITIPQDLISYVSQNFTRGIAVRSSALVEDADDHSYAGLFSSRFAITNEVQLKSSIQAALGDAFSERVVTYTLENGIPPKRLMPAFVIQEELSTQWAGVIFTTNPTGQSYDELYISFKSGHGENLMSGEEGGESYKVSKREALNFNHTDKELALKVRDIMRTSIKMEESRARPQDIEWGIDEQGVVYFQMRSVTTLGAIKEKPLRWTRGLSEERYPDVISPMGWSLLHGVFQVNLETLKNRFGLLATSSDDVAKVIDHYVFANDSFFAFPQNVQVNRSHQLKHLPSLFWATISWLFSVPVRLFKRSVYNVAHHLIGRLFGAFIFPQAKEIIGAWDQQLPITIGEFDRLSKEDPAKLSDHDIYQYRDQLEKIAFRYMEPDLAIYIIKMACIWMVDKLSLQLFPEHNKNYLLMQVTAGLESNRTLEMNMQLEALAHALKKNSQVSDKIRSGELQQALALLEKPEQDALTLFMQQNGHLTTNWDIREPVWEEAPEKVLAMVRPMLDLQQSIAERTRERQEGYKQFLQQLKQRLTNPWEQQFTLTLIMLLREFMRIDEEHHFYCSRVFKAVRKFYKEIAIRLCSRGVLSDEDQIFFLTEAEIRQAFMNTQNHTLAYKAARLRQSMERAKKIQPPHSYVGDFIEQEVVSAIVERPGQYRGEGASPGQGSGRVRIIENENDARGLEKGEIIVTQSPNPALTPLYSQAAGLIATTGSLLSHGLVSAREYGLPAVIGIGQATKIFKNGQKVWLDGRTGEVRLEEV